MTHGLKSKNLIFIILFRFQAISPAGKLIRQITPKRSKYEFLTEHFKSVQDQNRDHFGL